MSLKNDLCAAIGFDMRPQGSLSALRPGPNLFAGFITLAPRCGTCGLDLSFADSGDGPAVFVSLIGGFIVLGAALWTELRYEPPFWVHLVVFLPLTLIVCLGLLRPLKGDTHRPAISPTRQNRDASEH